MNDKARALMDTINATLKAPVLKMANDEDLKVTYLPTGVLPIDTLLGGGIPRGRFTTVTGDWSTLKSYVGLRAIATTQAGGGTCALIDTEHSFDPQWATDLGVDVDSLILQQPESGELAIDTAEALVRGGCDLIVFDSVAATLPQAERNKRLHDENVQPARIAQLMSVAMRKLTAANSHTAIFWINQLRMNIGVTFGNPEVATGGKSLPYYSSYIVNIRKTGKITRSVKTWDGEKWIDTKETYGQKFRAYVEKSKLSAPHREVHFVWDHEQNSVDEIGYLIAMGLESGYITQNGAMWECNGIKVRGKDKFKEEVKNNKALYLAIRDHKILESLGSPEPGKKKVRRKVRGTTKRGQTASQVHQED
jgi:recombination protein RecA